MTWNGRAAFADQEVEVAALVGLQYVFDIQLLVAGLRTRCAAQFARRLARRHLFVGNLQVQLAAGAVQLRPVQHQFYGDRSGTLRDPFGHVWSIATHIEDLSTEEICARSRELLARRCKKQSDTP